MIVKNSKATRPRLTIAVVMSVALFALVVWQMNAGTGTAQNGFEGAILQVTPEAGQTYTLTSLPAGPFSVEGNLSTLSGSVGTFRRTGVKLSSGVAVVTDVYELSAFNGVLTAQGTVGGAVMTSDGLELMVVTGGAGTYRGMRGEFQIKTTDSGSGAFSARLLQSRKGGGL